MARLSWISRAVPSRSCSSSATFSRQRSTGLAWAHRGMRGPPRRYLIFRPTPPSSSPASSFTELLELLRITRRKRGRGGKRKRGGWQAKYAGTRKKKLFDGPEEETLANLHVQFPSGRRDPIVEQLCSFLFPSKRRRLGQKRLKESII